RQINGEFVAMRMGTLRENGKTISIDPLSSRYVPRAGDLVVGLVEGMTNNIWFLDIGASFNAILPMSLAPWKVEFGAVREHLNVGEAVLCRVQEVDETHSAVATMKGMGLRKLKSGLLEEIPPHIIPQVIGKGGSMLQSLKDLGDCRLVVGQNGRVWIDGEHDGMRNLRAALQLIRDTAHLPGLQNRIDALANE
ncbi:MAG: KH domain-containing protein, partial [Candidatus Thermoplasmatota archaeon]|nr:KH domain-containing protein [Candidatus Thermoplasmatota archaeon]